MFSAIARYYDSLNLILSLGLSWYWRKRFLKEVCLSDSGRGGAQGLALDVCTGTGTLIKGLLKSWPSAIGVDFSAPMLTAARKRAGKEKSVGLVLADAHNLPFAESSFDVVTIAYGVRNLSDLQNGLREIRRALKPGKPVHILEFGRPPNRAIAWAYHLYLARIVPVVGGMLTGSKWAYQYLNESAWAFPSGAFFCEVLEKSGFSVVAAKPLSGGIVYMYSAVRS